MRHSCGVCYNGVLETGENILPKLKSNTEKTGGENARHRPCITGIAHDMLRQWFKDHGYPAFRADQIFDWLYKHNVESFEQMSNVPRALREELDREFDFHSLTLERRLESEDGSAKLLLRLRDGILIESVIMPEDGRLTLCLTTQAGCAMGCAFCKTGEGGLARNLEAAEIVEQVLEARRVSGRELSNLVFMGMGEPLANLENVAAALHLITGSPGMGMSSQRVVVSTSGWAGGIRKAARVFPAVGLAVSLNAPDDALRSRIMPVNRRFPIGELLAACREYQRAVPRPVTFEYVLLAGINDSDKHAHKTAKLIRNMPCRVNLIPFNPFPGCAFERPAEVRVTGFQNILKQHGLDVFIRRSRGRDIGAACGQLGGNT